VDRGEGKIRAQISVSANRPAQSAPLRGATARNPAKNFQNRKILGWVAIFYLVKLIPFPLA